MVTKTEATAGPQNGYHATEHSEIRRRLDRIESRLLWLTVAVVGGGGASVADLIVKVVSP